jgi:hypothetical protein
VRGAGDDVLELARKDRRVDGFESHGWRRFHCEAPCSETAMGWERRLEAG